MWRLCVELESLLSEAVLCKRFTADCRGAGDTRGLGFTRSKLRRDTPQAEERVQMLAIFDELEEKEKVSSLPSVGRRLRMGALGRYAGTRPGLEGSSQPRV